MGTRNDRARVRASRQVAVATSVAAAVALASTALPARAGSEADEGGERLLQSVSVSVAPDGSLTEVRTDVVSLDGEDDAEATEETFSAAEVEDELPVRVLTSWRTADGAGTDLEDLEGYSGRVRIDLTVQNLTVRPQLLEYDVDGAAVTSAALVGAPLTVVAAADLGDTAPEQVLTGETSGPEEAVRTNGVLSLDEDGDAQVQWASLLAPPTLGSTAQLTLVVDADDFEVPAFDLSVQPGLVTDPSLGALVDAAFNPEAGEELALQARTIEVVAAVNAVLARASDTISDVRADLTSSAATLGTRTVADLQGSARTVTSSMSALGATLQVLRSDVSRSLDQAGTSALAELDRAVTTVDRILGDTTAQPPTLRLDGDGCRTTVPEPRTPDSVFANLLEVTAQLEGYADATDACRTAIRTSIEDTIGPEVPTDAACTGSTSVTCSLFAAEATYAGIADRLRDLSAEAITLLNPSLYQAALDASAALNGELATVEQTVEDLNRGRIFTSTTLFSVRDDLAADGPVAEALADVQAAFDGLGDRAQALATALEGFPAQAAAASADLCAFRDAADGTLTPEQAAAFDEALARLQSTDCAGAALTAPSGQATPLFERVDADVLASVDGIVDEFDPEGDGAVAALAEIEAIRADLLGKVVQVLSYRKNPAQDGPTLEQLQNTLEGALALLETNKAALDQAVADLQEIAVKVPDISATIEGLVTASETEIAASFEEETRRVTRARDFATGELDDLLSSSAAGLRGAAQSTSEDGRRAIEGQKRDFADAQREGQQRVTGSIEAGLADVAAGVQASTRDTEAASTLLLADLRKVLLDLGERRVGGGGLLGTMANNAANARSADFQLALASEAATSYANVRGADVAGVLLRQAQVDAALAALARFPAFRLDVPSDAQQRTVFHFTVGGDR